jgi:hypothetical protein
VGLNGVSGECRSQRSGQPDSGGREQQNTSHFSPPQARTPAVLNRHVRWLSYR